MPTPVTPQDVYDKVQILTSELWWVVRLVVVLCGLVLLQILAKAIIFGRVMSLLHRVEILLTLAEKHGTLTDEQVESLKNQQTTATRTVVGAVKVAAASIKSEIPPKVVEEINRVSPLSHGDSGVIRTTQLPQDKDPLSG